VPRNRGGFDCCRGGVRFRKNGIQDVLDPSIGGYLRQSRGQRAVESFFKVSEQLLRVHLTIHALDHLSLCQYSRTLQRGISGLVVRVADPGCRSVAASSEKRRDNGGDGLGPESNPRPRRSSLLGFGLILGFFDGVQELSPFLYAGHRVRNHSSVRLSGSGGRQIRCRRSSTNDKIRKIAAITCTVTALLEVMRRMSGIPQLPERLSWDRYLLISSIRLNSSRGWSYAFALSLPGTRARIEILNGKSRVQEWMVGDASHCDPSLRSLGSS